MARISIVVCDICETTGKATKKWTVITPDGSRRSLDLCDSDAAPLAKIIGTEEKSEATPARRGRRGSGIQVTPIEELVKA